MHPLAFVHIKYAATRPDTHALVVHQQKLAGQFERSVCDALVGVRHFRQGNTVAAQRVFAGVYALYRGKPDPRSAYLKLFCLVYLKLLHRSLDSAATHAQQARAIKGQFLLKQLLPVPALEDKVLFQNSVELSQ